MTKRNQRNVFPYKRQLPTRFENNTEPRSIRSVDPGTWLSQIGLTRLSERSVPPRVQWGEGGQILSSLRLGTAK